MKTKARESRRHPHPPLCCRGLELGGNEQVGGSHLLGLACKWRPIPCAEAFRRRSSPPPPDHHTTRLACALAKAKPTPIHKAKIQIRDRTRQHWTFGLPCLPYPSRSRSRRPVGLHVVGVSLFVHTMQGSTVIQCQPCSCTDVWRGSFATSDSHRVRFRACGCPRT